MRGGDKGGEHCEGRSREGRENEDDGNQVGR